MSDRSATTSTMKPTKVTDEQIATIYEVSADIGKLLQIQSGLSPAEAVAALIVTAGRVFGREGYDHLNEAESWGYFASNSSRTFFELGFENERMHRDEKVS